MKVQVFLFAFESKGVIRYVDVPDKDISRVNSPTEKCDLAFYWGQNDFQPQNVRSVSCGEDVVAIDNEFWMVEGVGFSKITQEDFDGLKAGTLEPGPFGGVRKAVASVLALRP